MRWWGSYCWERVSSPENDVENDIVEWDEDDVIFFWNLFLCSFDTVRRRKKEIIRFFCCEKFVDVRYSQNVLIGKYKGRIFCQDIKAVLFVDNWKMKWNAMLSSFFYYEIDINRTLYSLTEISFKVRVVHLSNDSISPPPFETWISKRMKICGNSARFLLLTFYILFSYYHHACILWNNSTIRHHRRL